MRFRLIDGRAVQLYHKSDIIADLKDLEKFTMEEMARSSLTGMMHKVPLDIYAAGLHSRGSQEVHHYTELELRDRFALMCIAFDQPLYKVDKDLNIIEE